MRVHRSLSSIRKCLIRKNTVSCAPFCRTSPHCADMRLTSGRPGGTRRPNTQPVQRPRQLPQRRKTQPVRLLLRAVTLVVAVLAVQYAPLLARAAAAADQGVEMVVSGVITQPASSIQSASSLGGANVPNGNSLVVPGGYSCPASSVSLKSADTATKFCVCRSTYFNNAALCGGQAALNHCTDKVYTRGAQGYERSVVHLMAMPVEFIFTARVAEHRLGGGPTGQPQRSDNNYARRCRVKGKRLRGKPDRDSGPYPLTFLPRTTCLCARSNAHSRGFASIHRLLACARALTHTHWGCLYLQ